MRMHRSLLPLVLFSAAAGAHAQLYKSVGPDGKVSYSDSPPAAAKAVQTRTGPAPSAGAGLPFEVAEAVRHHPVTLYTSSPCAPCDQARTFLNTRGIPFTEKTVSTSDDLARLREAGGDQQLPFATIGRGRHKGFNPDGWGTALSAAGYPETSKLPNSYRNPAAEPAAPKAVATVQQAAAKPAPAPQRSDDVPPAAGNAPPGFRF